MTNPEKLCPGCGRRLYVGLACINCWPRLPWEIRRDILWGATTRARQARVAARKWLAEHPQP